MVRAFASPLVALAMVLSGPGLAQVTAPGRSIPAEPQVGAALTLGQAVERTLTTSPDLSAAANELAATEGGIMQAGTIPNPELETLVEGAGKSYQTTTIQINQPIELGGKRGARITAAERARDVAASDLEAKRAEIRASIVGAFFEALSAQERLRIAQASTELAQRSLNAASRRVQAGKVSPVEETRARIALSAARVEFGQAKSEWATARQQLASMWGATRPDFERVEGAPESLAPVPDLDATLARLNDAAAVQRVTREVQRREALVEVERSRRYPDLTLSLGTKREEEIDRDQVVVGFAIPIPLFDRNQGNLLEAMRRADKARDEEAAARAKLVADLTNAHTRYAAYKEEVELARTEIIPGAQSAFDAATKGFEAGKFNFLDVLDAQRTLFQAQSHYFRALAQAHRSAADIDRLLGERVIGGMQPPSVQQDSK